MLWFLRKNKHLLKKVIEKVLYKNFPCGVLSLKVGEPRKLPFRYFPGVTWSIDNAAMKIIDGKIIAKKDYLGEKSRGQLLLNMGFLKEIKIPVTIVPWDVKSKNFFFKKRAGNYTILGTVESSVYFTDERSLFKTRDCFETYNKISDIPWRQKYRSDRSLLLKTPVGWFLRTDGGVVYSKDLKTWSVGIDIGTRGMFQHLDYNYDASSQVTSVYAAEYSTDSSRRHGVYRGDYTPDGQSTWQRVFEFYSSLESKNGTDLENKLPAARHVHALAVDKKEDLLWVATGDSDNESGIFVSDDKGVTFKRYAIGSQHYRTLMLMFTEKYLYWNMDTHLQDQVVYRVKRSDINRLSIQCLPDAKSPYTGQESAFGAEVVCSLPYGAQWYGITVKDKKGQECIMMSASPESQVPETGEQPHRDWNARIFLLEKIDEPQPSVSEISAIPPLSSLSGKAKRYCRVDPRCQDSKGNIYFMGNNSIFNEAVVGRFK